MVSRFIPDSIKYGSLIAKAAADDEVPTAGYLQEEIKKLTYDPNACAGVEDALIARLDKRSSNVKLKTLRLIKLLCDDGAPGFRRDMQRRIKEVRDCLHWQGDPHPTMGDLPSKMVREAAQQVITVVFDAGPYVGAPSGGLGLTAASPPAHLAPRAAGSVDQRLPDLPPHMSQQQVPAPPQQSPGQGAGAATKYAGFGSENLRGAGGGGGDHKPLSSYFSNAPAPAAPAAPAASAPRIDVMTPGSSVSMLAGGVMQMSKHGVASRPSPAVAARVKRHAALRSSLPCLPRIP